MELVVAVRDDIDLSKPADLSVDSFACYMWVSLSSHLCSLLRDFGFHEVHIFGTSFDASFSFLAFCCAQEMYWSVVDFIKRFLLIRLEYC